MCPKAKMIGTYLSDIGDDQFIVLKLPCVSNALITQKIIIQRPNLDVPISSGLHMYSFNQIKQKVKIP